jgi:hypothetical protein
VALCGAEALEVVTIIWAEPPWAHHDVVEDMAPALGVRVPTFIVGPIDQATFRGGKRVTERVIGIGEEGAARHEHVDEDADQRCDEQSLHSGELYS